jgi:hypothetical protein
LTVDLIMNPRARRFQIQPSLVPELRRIAEGRARIHVSRSEGELAALANDILRRGSRLVLLAGGDGSLMAGVTALHRASRAQGRPMPALSPIPAGTAGTIASNWGIAGSPTRCLARILRGPNRLVARPSLRIVAHEPDAENERVGFIVGTGLVARFFRIYYAKGAPGYSGSAKLVARIFAESFVGGPMAREVLDPLPCHLDIDGAPCTPQAWSLICCSAIRNLGIHMLVNYRAGEDFQRPHLVATPMAPKDLGPRAPLVLAGRSLGGANLQDRLVTNFRVRFPNHQPGPYVLDGELLLASSVEVSAGPILTIATPA